MQLFTEDPPSSSAADRRWWALALLAMAEFVVVLDASIVNIALPSIGRGLHISLANLSWVVNAYVLTFGGFLLLGGRIADLFGRRLIFTVGLGVFSLASLLGGRAARITPPEGATPAAARIHRRFAGPAGVSTSETRELTGNNRRHPCLLSTARPTPATGRRRYRGRCAAGGPSGCSPSRS